MRADKLPVPVGERPEMAWGSDVIAETLSRLDIPYLSFVPGASYRGLHDSLVNYLGNTKPEMVLCLHEEHAVAVAQGYAKVTGRPMAVALHSNVGLMHATMAIFDAYCDRVPMLILGATGPVDASERRPWIDWIHTAADQGALIRNYCKWDDQPGSVQAAVESLIRADAVTRSYPAAPTYVCLDAGMQEARLPGPVELPPLDRYRSPEPPAPGPELARRVLGMLRAAQRPLVMVGRGGRDARAWDARVRLAEKLGACALTDLKTAAAFPTGHRLHPATPGTRLTPSGLDLLRRADVVLSLDWIDLAGTFQAAFGSEVTPTVISCTGDAALHNGWSKDHFALPVADVAVCAHPDALVAALLAGLGEAPAVSRPGWPGAAGASRLPRASGDGEDLVLPDLAAGLRQALTGRQACWISLPHGWPGDAVEISGPLDYLGEEGGGGVGAGPGIAVGAALALQGTGRLPLAVVGDGDYLMGGSALWTATHHRLPLLVVVANNRSYFNDEVHQERMARMRGRPAANRGVGQHIRDPDPDLAAFARSLGAHGYGPVRTQAELKDALTRAVLDVEASEVAVVDVHVRPYGDEGVPAGAHRRGG
ncbi:MAG TPA: thiamine pyrophosphate-binding protein [Streptosporangiaceae bacterium]|nr:thiamine pyrophosphate-binding protein [Streptosporangiaceae bacterium]